MANLESDHTDKLERPDAPGQNGHLTPLSLLQRARTKDPEAWCRLVELYGPLIRCWCHRDGVHDQDAEEVAQEVFASAAAALSNFRRDRIGDTFRGWLRVITRNAGLAHFRRNKDRIRAEGGSEAFQRLQDIADSHQGEEEEEEEKSEIGLLFSRAAEQVRGEFEEKTWQAFWLTVIEGRPPTALADELGMSSAAIRQAKSRVLRRLKQEVGDILD